jgi:ELWxxDGT repeat protein
MRQRFHGLDFKTASTESRQPRGPQQRKRAAIRRLVFENLHPRHALAADVQLVEDINLVPNESYPRTFVQVGDSLFFKTSKMNSSNSLLWKSDGTEQGTELVKEITEGMFASDNFTAVGSNLFFSSSDNSLGFFGNELWKSDGTPAGTVIVKDIRSSGSSYPSNFVNVNGILFFTANNGTNGTELWRSDGTEAGTFLVKDIYAGTPNGSPKNLANVKGTLYFTANDGTSGYELWKSDGTSDGTVRIRDIRTGAPSAEPKLFTAFGDYTYFTANDGTNGIEFWRTNGTDVTELVKDINPGSSGTFIQEIVVINGKMYFAASDSTNGSELWVSDGTTAGTTLVKDILTGASSSSPSALTNVNGTIFFTAWDSTNGRELWKTNGTSAGTQLVKNIRPSSSDSNIAEMKNLNGILYFKAYDGNKTRLWKSDGSSSGTVDIAVVNERTSGLAPSSMVNINGSLYFNGNGISGEELWKSDGTATGTVLVKDFTPGTKLSTPKYLANINGKLYFSADDGVNGREIWVSSGTAENTNMIRDIGKDRYTGSSFTSSDPKEFTNVNGVVFFTANDGTNGTELWKTDGTETGTVMVKNIASDPSGSSSSSSPSNLTNVNGTLYFHAWDSTGGRELWKSDGTQTGTVRVKDIVAGSSSAYPQKLTNANGTLMFTASTSTSGREWWKSDGTVDGTVLVKDIYSGSGSSVTNYTASLYTNGKLFFTANNNSNGYELWKSDGTSDGTTLVRDLRVGATSSYPNNFTVIGNQVFFTTNDSKLWKTDGTDAGTVLIKDLSSTVATSPTLLTNVNGTLYFAGYSNTSYTYRYLWKSDGTADGTVPVKDFGVSADITQLTNFNGTLYFNAKTSSDYILMTSDGTEAGTVRVDSLTTSTVPLNPLSITPIGNSLFFSAVAEAELWKLVSFSSALSNTAIDENAGANAIVGQFSTLGAASGSTFSYSLVAGTGDSDNGLFTISGGELRTTNNFDYESKSSYSIRVRATDQDGASGEKVFTISVRNVNEAPNGITLSSDIINEGAGENALIGSLSTADPDSSNSFTYSFTNGEGDADNAAFSIVGDQLRAKYSFDFETQSSYTVRIQSTDQGGLSFAKAFTITVTNGNDAPTNIFLSTTGIAENAIPNVHIGTLSTTDVDAGNTFTYTLVSGTGDTDNASFAIEGNSLRAPNPFDYETKSSYSIRIRSTDQGGLFTEKQFTITVADVNEAPTNLAISSTSIAENAGANANIGALSTTDPDANNTFTYSLVSGSGDTDNAAFNIHEGNLRATNNLDFESKSSYSVRIRTTDQNGAFLSKSFNITVTNANDAPSAISLSKSYVYNSALADSEVALISVTDPDTGDTTFTLELVAGAGDTHNNRFEIQNGRLILRNNTGLANATNLSIRLRATDPQGASFTTSIPIEVRQPAFSNFTLSNRSLPENSSLGTSIGNFSAVGVNTNTVSFSLTNSSNDNANFTIEANTLKAAASFDAETKAFYQVEVKATVDDMVQVRQFTILVDPVNEFAPVLVSPTQRSVEEGGRNISTLVVTDSDVQPSVPNFTLTGVDASRLEVVGNQLRFKTTPDFEAPMDQDQDNTYLFTLQVTEGSLSNTYAFQVAVTNTNDVPEAIAISSVDYPTLAIPEDIPVGTIVGIFSAIDGDGPGSPTFQFNTAGAPTNNNSFEIIGNTLRTSRRFDFEKPEDRNLVIQVVATDGLGAVSAATRFNLSVTDRDEAPKAESASISLERNTTKNITLSAIGSGGALTYTITQQPSKGTLTGNLPNLIYTPNLNFLGEDEFYFTAEEAGATSLEAVVKINVTGIVPTVTLNSSGPYAEGIGTIDLSIVLDQPADVDLTILVQPTSASTASEQDYSLPVRSVTIPKGQTTRSIGLTLTDDRNYEMNENLVLQIVASELFVSSVTPTTITVLDNDPVPTLTLPNTFRRVSEVEGNLEIPLRLSAPSYLPIVIPFSFGGNAQSGTDYIPPTGTSITIAPGQLEATLMVPIVNDTYVETLESWTTTFTAPTGISFEGGLSSAIFTANIQDDDAPVVSLQTTILQVGENAGTIELIATLDRTLSEQIVVPVSIEGTASPSGLQADYTLAGQPQFLFLPGATTASILINILDDSLVESNGETITIALNPSGTDQYKIGDKRSGFYKINDNDTATIEFETSNITLWENGGSATIRVKMDRALQVPVTMNLQLSNTSATYSASPADYSLNSTSITIPAGQTSGEIQLSIVDDTTNEQTEELQLGLFLTTEGPDRLLGKTRAMRVMIRDNDPLFMGVTSIWKSVKEDSASTAEYLFAISAPTNTPVSIPFSLSGTATTGSDFNSPSTYIATIPVGYTTAKLDIPIKQDVTVEGDESIIVSTGTVSNYPWSANASRSAEVKIIDDEEVTVRFATASQSLSESRTGSFFFRSDRYADVEVRLSASVSRDVVVTMSFTGSASTNDYYHDYKPQAVFNNRLTIPAGTLSRVFRIRISDDSAYEGDESLVISLVDVSSPASLPSQALRTHVMTIIDNDSKPTFVTQPKPTSTNVMINANALALPPLNSAPATGPLGFKVITISNSGGMINSGALAIGSFSAYGGVLEGSTAFFDANRNGLIDQVARDIDGETVLVDEPATATLADGSFGLDLLDQDTNGNGQIDIAEGRFVITGGTDLSTSLPLRIPMMAPVGVYRIDPASTLAEGLTRNHEFSVQDAFERVAEGLDVPDFDFIRQNALYGILNGELASSIAYERMIEVYTAILNLSEYLSALGMRDLVTVSQSVVDALSDSISTPDSAMDLSNAEFLRTLFAQSADAQSISYDIDDVNVVMNVVAGGIARLRSITLNGTTEAAGDQFLLSLYQTKKVLQGELAQAVRQVGTQSRTPAQLLADFTGSSLEDRISSTSTEVSVPPVVGVGSATLVEGDSGSHSMRFAIVKRGIHNYPISIKYMTAAGTAHAGSDYTHTEGTLTWDANDSGTTKYVDVPIIGDTIFEADESMSLLLVEPQRLAIRKSEGFGFLINDDETTLNATDDTAPNEIIVESTRETYSLLKNNISVISGEFANPLPLHYQGATAVADIVRYVTVGQDLRADTASFSGGESTGIVDQFVLQGGIYKSIEVTFQTAESLSVRLAGPETLNYPNLDLDAFEQISLGSTSVETLLLRIPSTYLSITIEEVPGDSNMLQCSFGAVGTLNQFRIKRPSDRVVILGIDGNVTVDNLVSGLSVAQYPSGLFMETSSLDEGQSDLIVGPIQTAELGFNSTSTYTIVPLASAVGDFEIVDGNKLKIVGLIDYESTPILRTKIRATSTTNATVESIVQFVIQDISEAPTDISLTPQSIPENNSANAVVGTFSTTDAESWDTFTYTLAPGEGDSDNEAFNINGNQLRAVNPFDFEAKSSYSVRIQTTDLGGLTYQKSFIITVTDVNESPSDISLSNATVAENTGNDAIVGALSTTDPDANENFTYSLVTGSGDSGNSAFRIDGNQLLTRQSLDFETQATYTVRIRSTDRNGAWTEKSHSITVSDANDTPTNIFLSNNSLSENNSVNFPIGTFSTIDQDSSDTFTYALVDGTGDQNNALFQVIEGQLLAKNNLDFETQSTYSVRVQSTDQTGASFVKVFVIELTDVNEVPIDLLLSNSSIPENAGINAVVGTLSTNDPDNGDSFAYSFATGQGDADNNLFNIAGNVLRASQSLNFTSQNSYSVRLRTTDSAGNTYERSFEITKVDYNVYILGTAASDAISLVYQGDGTNHHWVVSRNGAILFDGQLHALGAVVLDGLGGNDSVQVAGRSVTDQFVLDGNTLTLEGSRVQLTSVESLRVLGFAGDDQLQVISGSVLFDGGIGNDQLSMSNSDNQIAVTGFNTGNVNGAIVFANTESLQAGSGNDQFVFTSIGRLSGGLFGGDGQDSVNLAAKTTAQTINLQSGVTSVSNGFGQIEQVVASNAVGDLLIATNTANVWNIQGINSGTLNSSLSFSGFESIAGGTAADQFLFAANGQITSRISGGDGADTLDLSQGTTPQTHRISALSAVDNLVGAYTSIEQVTGNAIAGTKLIGPSTGAAWSVMPDGQISINGINYRSIREISGGAGADTILGPAQTNSWSILAPNAGRLESSNWSIDFQGTENLYGGTSTDNFAFTNEGRLSGWITAGSGSDQLSLAAISSDLLIDASGTPKVQLAGNLQTVLGGYNAVETVLGNALSGSKIKGGNTATSWLVSPAGQIFHNSISYLAIGGILAGTGLDILTGPSVATQWSILGSNAGQVSFASTSLTFSGMENLTGGSNNDAFDIAPAGALSGNLNGGTGTGLNSISYSQWDAAVSVNLASTTNGNATAITGRTTNMQMVTGGAGNDILVGQSSKSTILVGLGGNDNLTGGTQRDLLLGGLGSDTLNGSSGDDLLVASLVSFEAQREGLIAIYNEWNSTRTFAQRTANLWGSGTGTRSNGSTFLNSDANDAVTDTVFADGDIDSLTGGSGQDWFFADLADSNDFSSTGTAPDKLNRPLSP